jgi:hypothetical protein
LRTTGRATTPFAEKRGKQNGWSLAGNDLLAGASGKTDPTLSAPCISNFPASLLQDHDEVPHPMSATHHNISLVIMPELSLAAL